LFLILSCIYISCTLKAFTQTAEHKIVSLPFEITVTEKEKLLLKENGIIEFANKTFVYKEDGEKYPIRYNALITIYCKNNLCGLNIMEETGTSYTIIINIKAKKEIPYEKDPYFRFWDFFAIENYFILTSAEKAFAFNDSTGELLWTQTYQQRDGRKIIANKDHFIIDDVDGNRYRINKDGNKIKL